VSAFPLTDEAFGALTDGAATLAHVDELEQRLGTRAPVETHATGGPDAGAAPDFDVALAGGGLSLVYAALLSRRGLRVAVCDRRVIGCGRREWNISRPELAPLVASGLFTDGEVADLVPLAYDDGIVRWHGGGTYAVTGVLDCVVDAERLLAALRARAEAAGATLLDRHALTGYRVGRGGVEVRLSAADPKTAERRLTARVLLDGMGAESPHAAFDLMCPTVGGVLAGLDEGDDPLCVQPRRGEILVTTEGLVDDTQHIWEGFPQPDGRFTTYLFYYTEPSRLGPRPLRTLYERFFATRPRYKRGAARLAKATYGFIPAHSRLRPMPASPCDRVLLVGDAAARHSPLTFCGFGSMIRSFLPVGDGLCARLAEDRLDRRALASVWREPPGLQVMGGLTLMMVPGRGRPGRDPDDVNRLLDAAFATLSEMGNDIYGAFVRDQIGFRDFVTFMRRTAARRPGLYDEVLAHMSKAEIARWSMRLGRLGLAKWRTG
jgi:lycopene cyclase CruA